MPIKQLVADLSLDKKMLQDVLSKTFEAGDRSGRPRSLFRTLSYPQILLKTLFKIGERQVSHLLLAQIA